MKRALAISALALIVGVNGCSDKSAPAESEALSSEVASEAAKMEAEKPVIQGEALESAYLSSERRVTAAQLNGDTVYVWVRMEDGDIGGIIEAATTPRNLSSAAAGPDDLPPEVKTLAFLTIDKTGNYFGRLDFARADLHTPLFKSNYSVIMNKVQKVELSETGIEAARSFCAERAAEASKFCGQIGITSPAS